MLTTQALADALRICSDIFGCGNLFLKVTSFFLFCRCYFPFLFVDVNSEPCRRCSQEEKMDPGVGV